MRLVLAGPSVKRKRHESVMTTAMTSSRDRGPKRCPTQVGARAQTETTAELVGGGRARQSACPTRSHADGARAHDAARGASMTFPPYTRIREGEGQELFLGVRKRSHSARSRPSSAISERIEQACPGRFRPRDSSWRIPGEQAVKMSQGEQNHDKKYCRDCYSR
jgi:hypothetical protein